MTTRKRFNQIVHSDFSQHTLYVAEIDADNAPEFVDKGTYNRFFAVHNSDKNGCVFMYLGKGNRNAPSEIVAWYVHTGSFWSSYGKTFKEAIEGAQRDGWMYA